MRLLLMMLYFFFFKQKTEYDMRISDWSSDVCSSDLLRDSIGELASLPILTPSRQQITLGTVTSVKVSDGPPMLRSENGRPVTWIYVDSRGRDLQGLVQDIQPAIARAVQLPPSVSVSYTGQFEFLVRATAQIGRAFVWGKSGSVRVDL